MDNLDEMELKLLRKMNQDKDAEIASLKAEVERLRQERDDQFWAREQERKDIARLTIELNEYKSWANGRGKVELKARIKELEGIIEKWVSDEGELASLKAENERLKEERDDALATQIPPDSGAIRKLGERLADLLDEDDWNNAEPLLLAAQQSIAAAEQENERLRKDNFAHTISLSTTQIWMDKEEELKAIRADLASAGNELDVLRKVVWHLEPHKEIGWVLWEIDESNAGLDIAKLQREMGK